MSKNLILRNLPNVASFSSKNILTIIKTVTVIIFERKDKNFNIACVYVVLLFINNATFISRTRIYRADIMFQQKKI